MPCDAGVDLFRLAGLLSGEAPQLFFSFQNAAQIDIGLARKRAFAQKPAIDVDLLLQLPDTFFHGKGVARAPEQGQFGLLLSARAQAV